MCRRGLSFKGGALYSVFILFIIFSLLIQPLRAAALTEDILDKFAANDIIFYDPEDCDEDPNKICIAPSGDKITWIGDSLTALSTKDRLEKFFPGVDYGPSYNDQSSYVQSGKALTHDNGEDGGPGGVEILRGIVSRNELRPFLVFALGANEPWTEQTLKDVLDLAGSSQVIIVTSRTINYTSSYHYDYAKENEMLLEKAKTEDNLSVGDWASEVKDEWYASDGVHYIDAGYDAYLQFIKDTLPKSCSGSLCGDTAPQKYWSALTQHFGVAPAAGIMGNIDSEGGYNPVGVESCTYLNPYNFDTKSWTNGWPSFEYYRDNNESQSGRPTGVGAFGITAGRAEYLNHINEEAPDLMKYFSDPSTYSLGGCSGLPMNGAETGGDALLALIGDTDYDRLVELEVEWMYKTLEEHWDFDLEAFKNMSDPGEAAVYFLHKYERPANPNDAARAEYGRKEYEKFKDYVCTSKKIAGTNNDFSTTGDLSGGNTVKYDMTDDQIEELLKFALWMADDDNPYDDIISGTLDDFEWHHPDGKGIADKVIEYIKDEKDEYIYKDKYKEYSKLTDDEKKEIKIESEELEKAKSIIVDGMRTTTAGKVETTDGKDKNKSYCSDSKKGKGAARIAEAAALMSWPVQKGQGDDEHAGMCYDGSSWVQYTFDQTCNHNPRTLYKENWDKFHNERGVFDIYEDCGFYVATVLHYLDIATNDMWNQPYFNNAADAAEDWKKVADRGLTEDQLKAGDVLWSPQHIIIYAGKYGNEYGTFSHASREQRVGEIGDAYNVDQWTVYRYVGDKLGGGDVDEEDGLTLEQATQFVINYGANKNNSSYNAVGAGQWFIDCEGNDETRGWGGSNCVTFSAFYANKFTSMRYGGGHGYQWVDNAEGKLTRIREPRVWAVFSWISGEFGHTGVILGHHDGEWIVGHASCSSEGHGAGNGERGEGAGFVIHSADINAATMGNPHIYAYPDEVDFDAISEYLETGV